MRSFAFLTIGLVLASSPKSFAMSKPLPDAIRNELIGRAEVKQPFSINATDGTLIKFVTGSDETRDSLKTLPAESGADHSKCGGPGDVNRIIALANIMIHVVDSRALSPADIQVIQQTPRCDPYNTYLASIAAVVSPSPIHNQDLPEKLSIVKSQKGYAIQLVTKAGRFALFQIANKLDGIKSVKDLGRINLDAASTGQNLAIKFDVSAPTTSNPSHTSTDESCTIFDKVERCDGRDGRGGPGGRDRGACHWESVSYPGHRRADSESTFTSYEIQMSLVAPNGTVVMTGDLSDSDFNTDTQKSACYPDRGGPGRF